MLCELGSDGEMWVRLWIVVMWLGIFGVGKGCVGLASQGRREAPRECPLERQRTCVKFSKGRHWLVDCVRLTCVSAWHLVQQRHSVALFRWGFISAAMPPALCCIKPHLPYTVPNWCEQLIVVD